MPRITPRYKISKPPFVNPVMGNSLSSRAEGYPEGRIPRHIATEVNYQIALGLDYLWKCGVAHGDLYSGNVLFTYPTVSTLREERIKYLLGEPERGTIQRLDGEPSLESLMPRYLVRPETFSGNSMEVRIVDLGNAFFHDNPPRTLHTPWHMRAPEALFDQPLSRHVDMWSMGCLIFETITGRSFISAMLADRFSAIREIRSHIGPPPKNWAKRLEDNIQERIDETNVRMIGLDRYLRLAYSQDDAQLIEMEADEDDYPIEDYEKAKPEFTDAELDAISDIISRLLTYVPASRGTPETLLRSLRFEGIKV